MSLLHKKLTSLRVLLQSLSTAAAHGWAGHRFLARAALPIVGFLAFVWFCVRVLPKPSRAGYPCQRAAFPLASTFVLWVLGLFAVGRASRLFSRAVRSRQIFLAAGALALTISLAVYTFGPTTLPLQAASVAPTRIPNAPAGTAVGANPGRVVWIQDPAATDWEGDETGDEWWSDENTNPRVVNAMFDKAILQLAGTDIVAEAWEAFFRDYNTRHGRGAVGYTPGEKFMIKVNFTTTAGFGNIDANGNKLNTRGKWWAYLYDSIDASPQVTMALLTHLVEVVGVAQEDISIGDPLGEWPNRYFNYYASKYPKIRYVSEKPINGQVGWAPSTHPAYWGSTTGQTGKRRDYVPDCYANATYLINLAVMKTHERGGMTVCGKNHFGSMGRTPNDPDYFDWHSTLPAPDERTIDPRGGRYRAQVDLLGHPDIGGKTLLCVVDALYVGTGWAGVSTGKWNSAPFNGDWPSSILVSQDPVAIDAVSYDLLRMEYPDYLNPYGDAATDYLVEAALANNPPSGSVYDPDGDGVRLGSLGVFEIWNNDLDRKYSRNLGIGDGIELLHTLGVEVPPEGALCPWEPASGPSLTYTAAFNAWWETEAGAYYTAIFPFVYEYTRGWEYLFPGATNDLYYAYDFGTGRYLVYFRMAPWDLDGDGYAGNLYYTILPGGEWTMQEFEPPWGGYSK